VTREEALAWRPDAEDEAFTGVPRFHEDIDLVVYTEHVPQLREQLGGVFHLWSNDGGTPPSWPTWTR
jgi:hypothetical protein